MRVHERYVVVPTPNGNVRVLRYKRLRTIVRRKRQPLSLEALLRNERDTQFWGATAKSKHERKSNAMKIALRGLLPAYLLRETPLSLPPLLTGSKAHDDTPVNPLSNLSALERWSGKPVALTQN